MLSPLFEYDNLVIGGSLSDFGNFKVAEEDDMSVDSISTVSSTESFKGKRNKKRTFEKLGSTFDDDSREIYKGKQTLNHRSKRKLTTLVPNGYTRIYKTDIIRHYATMFEYVLNSYDFSLFSSFFHTFAAKKVIFTKEDHTVNPFAPKIYQLQGRNACVYFLSLCCQLSFDRVMLLKDCQLVQRLENLNIVELNGTYTCDQHRLFDAMAGDIMELLTSQFPDIIESPLSCSVSKHQKQRRMEQKENSKLTDSPTSTDSLSSEDFSLAVTENFDDDERYFVEHFRSLKDLSSACYSSPFYLSLSHLFDPLSSPCVSSACAFCSNSQVSSSSSILSPSSPSFPFTSGRCVNLLERSFARFPAPQSFYHHGSFSLVISLKTKLIEKISFVCR
jgi:hypothetical protein